MKILVLGAAGRTGRAVLDQALARGHEVTALAHRDPTDALPARPHPRARRHRGGGNRHDASYRGPTG